MGPAHILLYSVKSLSACCITGRVHCTRIVNGISSHPCNHLPVSLLLPVVLLVKLKQQVEIVTNANRTGIATSKCEADIPTEDRLGKSSKALAFFF